MDIIKTLNQKLLEQPFENENEPSTLLHKYKNIAKTYAQIENSIAVLSDMQNNKSYIYYGGIANEIGLERSPTQEINSIWEEDILNRIYHDDLLRKHSTELQFFNFIKDIPSTKRGNYYVASKLHILNKLGEYILIQHRMFYVCSTLGDNLWLALCLYNFMHDKNANEDSYSLIINSETGDVIKPDKQKNSKILSKREKEILDLIRKGKLSKEIANTLSISINTVNRHRQNILQKLKVDNSIEACRIVELMGIL